MTTDWLRRPDPAKLLAISESFLSIPFAKGLPENGSKFGRVWPGEYENASRFGRVWPDCPSGFRNIAEHVSDPRSRESRHSAAFRSRAEQV
jgi:hypothetical protein